MQCDVYQQFLNLSLFHKAVEKAFTAWFVQKMYTVVSIVNLEWIYMIFWGVYAGEKNRSREMPMYFFVVQNDTHHVVCAMVSH